MALTLKQALAMFWEQIQVRFVKREDGKGLSTNDFTTEEKNKLASLENTTVDTTLTIEGAAADAKAVGDLWLAYPDDDDLFWLLQQIGLVIHITDNTGAVLTDETGAILLL